MKSSSSTAPVSPQQVEKKSSSPEFIQTISIKGKQSIDAPPLVKSAGSVNTGQVDKSSIELASPVLLKYAILMNAPVEELNNDKLINFIDEWYGTKYRLGGDIRTEWTALPSYSRSWKAYMKYKFRVHRRNSIRKASA